MKSQVIIPGAVKVGRNAKGFNLNKFVKKLLESMGFAVTIDCCTYYPSFPLLTVADPTNPTDAEILASGIPPRGMFSTYDSDTTDYRFFVVNGDNSAIEFTTS